MSPSYDHWNAVIQIRTPGGRTYNHRDLVSSEPRPESVFANAHAVRTARGAAAARAPRLACPTCAQTILHMTPWEPRYRLVTPAGWEPLPASPIPIGPWGAQVRAACGCMLDSQWHDQWMLEVAHRLDGGLPRGMPGFTPYQLASFTAELSEDIARLVMHREVVATLVNKLACDYWLIALSNELAARTGGWDTQANTFSLQPATPFDLGAIDWAQSSGWRVPSLRGLMRTVSSATAVPEPDKWARRRRTVRHLED